MAIIVPDEEVLPTWATKNGLKNLKASTADLCRNEKLKNEIMASITKLGKDAGLKGFEQVRVNQIKPAFVYCFCDFMY